MKELVTASAILLWACQPATDGNETERTADVGGEAHVAATEDEFLRYLKNFKELTLPVTIKGCYIDVGPYKELDRAEFPHYAEDYARAFGRVPANGDHIAVLTLGAADCYLPTLTSYRPDGRFIGSKVIAIGGCGAGCGFTCEEFMVLNKDLSFYTSDTISTYTCDSLGYEIPGTYEHYVVAMSGRLLTNGTIEATERIRRPIPVRDEHMP